MEYNYCKDCAAFMDPSSREKDWGECRLNPPQVVGCEKYVGEVTTRFPLVVKYEWCLQFKEKKDGIREPG